MERFFNMENPFWQLLGKLADLMILNLLFLACSIPVFTIGASFTAMSYVTLKMRDDDEGYIARSFFHSFKENFKQSTLVWLLMLLFAFILYVDWNMTGSLSGTVATVMKMMVCIGIVIWLMVTLYVFPLIARFSNTTKNMLKNALLLSFGNAPRALLVSGVFIACVFATLYSTRTLSVGLLLWILFGFSLISLLNSTMQIKLFRRLAGEDENGSDGNEEEEPWDVDRIESDLWPQPEEGGGQAEDPSGKDVSETSEPSGESEASETENSRA